MSNLKYVSIYSSLLLPFIVIHSIQSSNDISCDRLSNRDAFLKAIASIKGKYKGSAITGIILFEQSKILSHTIITCNISGLPRGRGLQLHGIHIHEFGIREESENETVKCNSAGPHFNPISKNNHGDLFARQRHAGDLGNVVSDNNGNIITIFRDDVIKLDGFFNIIGRTIVLHQLQDDLGLLNDNSSKTTGNSGSRIACGEILKC